MRRVSWVVGVVVGVVLLVGAGVVRWVVAPAVTVLPSDTNTTRVYTGVAASMFNPSALTGTLFGPAVLHNVPVSVHHDVKVTATKGNNARVTDHRVVTVPGNTVADLTALYAVDRKTMDRGSGFSGVVDQSGVTFNWPIHTQPQNYIGWVPDTHTTTLLTYDGTATRGGVKTYVYHATVATLPIADKQLLAALPAAMPKSQLDSSVGTLGLTHAQLVALGKLMPTLPDPVPFAYTYAATSTYWVAPDSGLVVDVSSHEIRTANIVAGSTLVPVAPVLDLTYTSPRLTLAAAAGEARDKANQMAMIHTTVPLAMSIAGAVILLLLLMLLPLRRRSATPPTAAVAERELTPTG